MDTDRPARRHTAASGDEEGFGWRGQACKAAGMTLQAQVRAGMAAQEACTRIPRHRVGRRPCRNERSGGSPCSAQAQSTRRPAEGIYTDFRTRVIEAEEAAEIRMVALVMKAASEDPKHARREHYGRSNLKE